MAKALPGGYRVGEKVFLTGASKTFPSGDKLVHGGQGEVVGPATHEDYKDKRVCVLFPGNKGSVACLLTTVSRDAPPPLPGGYRVGKKVFYTGASQTISNGNKVVHGGQGEVTGPTDGALKGKCVAVLFPGNKDSVGCLLTELSRVAPPVLGSTSNQDEVAVVGERSFAQRDAECRKRAIDLDTETPRKRGRAATGAMEERIIGARSVCTAAVDARVRELTQPAFEQWMADQIDDAELDRRKAEARAKATAEHAPLTELESASSGYMEAVSARTKAEAAEDAAEAKLEAVLRALERGQPGSSGVKAE